MKISVITPTLNSEEFIEDALNSVLKQTYDDYEYLVIDGYSTDNTLNIVESKKPKFNGKLKIVTGKDKGIFDAMNKGIELANGEIIMILCSDDFYISNKVFELVSSEMINREIDALYHDVIVVDRKNKKKPKRYWKENPNSFFSKIEFGWFPAHLSFITRKKYYTEFGGFNTSFKIASDIELMTRFLKKNKLKIKYIPKTLLKMRSGGTSNKSIYSIIKGNFESFKALRNNEVFPYLVFLKVFRKLYHIYLAKKLLKGEKNEFEY